MKRQLMFLFALLCLLCGCEDETAPVFRMEPTGNSRTVVITCAGDCTLGTDVAFSGITLPVEYENQNQDGTYFFANVQPFFASDDLTIVNLEGTLTDRGERQEKTYAFRGDPAYTEILKLGSVEAVTLANNHTYDYGEIGLTDTKQHLDEAGIHWVEGLHTKVISAGEVKVGLIGLNGLSSRAKTQLPTALEQVKDGGAELIVVQFHWGIEGKQYPTQDQISLAHQAIDLGADLVIGHHPHVLQGIERYQNRTILYSLGNFCFGGNQNPTDKDTMLYRQTFTFTDDEVLDWENYQVIPCSISSVTERNNYQPTPVYGEDASRIREKIRELSAPLGETKIRFLSTVGQNAL
ncbi:MAG: CapA family protein [Clostridia bacterium]|nr:CapA family protein [Clostridia bacterium]